MYVAINWVSGGNVISDSVTACTFFVALYLGVTGFACTWWYRKSLLSSARTFWLCGVFPFLSGVMLFVILGWSVYFYTDPDQSYTSWHMPFWPHWTIGGVLSIGIVTALIGLGLDALAAAQVPGVLQRPSPCARVSRSPMTTRWSPSPPAD